MKKSIIIVLAAMLFAAALFSGYQVWLHFADEQETEEQYNNLAARIEQPPLPTKEQPPSTQAQPGESLPEWTVNDQYGLLFEQNTDMIGWIAIDGTTIAYPVTVGTWVGGVVGLKSILGQKSRAKTFDIMDSLSSLGYVSYSLDSETKKPTYKITDWVVECSGADCMDGAVYTTDGYGFLCLPRNITQQLVEKNYTFEDADAWLDLWCHTVFEDPRNVFSYKAPIIQFGQYGAALTLENLGRRWNWEKTKVWRFLQKHGDAFTLHKLPGSFGCLIFNNLYPTGTEFAVPTQAEIVRILGEIRILSENTHFSGPDNCRINRMIAWHSRQIHTDDIPVASSEAEECRVAVSCPIIRAYISQCWNCKNSYKDCWMKYMGYTDIPAEHQTARGPCREYGPRFISEGGSP